MNQLSKIVLPQTNGLSLVHETPVRLRFKLPFLKRHAFSITRLRILLAHPAGIGHVRINRAAASIIYDYDGNPAVRAQIIEDLAALRPDNLPQTVENEDEPLNMMPFLGSVALVALMPFLGPNARAALTFLNISGRLIEGASSLRKGIKVELLDASAVALSALRREYVTVNITESLLKLGHYLEETTLQKSDDMLRHLLRPAPTMAWVERAKELVQIPDNEIREGEKVVANVGDRIPVDGLVLRGTASVNQSSVTGEAEPVRKEVMDRVIAGTIVEDGRLIIEARHVGTETTTARISSFIETALDQTSDTQRTSEALSDRRVYLSLGTSALVYGITRDLSRLESALLVDYSCAVKLGTPLAFKSCLYNASLSGLLIKGGQTIEQLAKVDTFVFDKTGTLTYSDLDVSDVVVLDEENWSSKRLLALTASIEEHAHHPIAEAIVQKAREEQFSHIEHGEVDYLVAHGMSCPVEGSGDILIGSRHYLEDHEEISFDAYEDVITRLQQEGKILLYIASGTKPLGIIALQDQIREGAAAQLAQLRAMGIRKLVMLTGDSAIKARAIAEDLDIDIYHSELEPEDKAGLIKDLQRQGDVVAFVGDGVNDGPALVTADVGIAMPRGAEIARATADVVLLEDQLALLSTALDMSKRTMGLVETNFKLAAGINTGILFGALSGSISPVTTSILHNGTTVGLLLKALAGVKAKSQNRS